MAKRVCVAIADEVQRDLIHFALTSRGYEVSNETDTACAIERVAEAWNAPPRFDLLITDDAPSTQDGVDPLTELGRHGIELPILLVSKASAGQSGKDPASGQGSATIAKPLNPYALIDRVDALTGSDPGGRTSEGQENFEMARLEVFYNRAPRDKARS
jgi:DNA-binding response OmpR family regulator